MISSCGLSCMCLHVCVRVSARITTYDMNTSNAQCSPLLSPPPKPGQSWAGFDTDFSSEQHALGICFCVSVRTLRIRCKMDFGKRACSYHRSIMCACACVHVAGRFISSAKIPIHHEFAYVLHTPTRLRWVLSASAAAVRRCFHRTHRATMTLFAAVHTRTHAQTKKLSAQRCASMERCDGASEQTAFAYIFANILFSFARGWAHNDGMQSVAMRYIIFAPRKHGHANTHKVFCAHGADAWKRGCTWASWILIRVASSLSNIICNAVWCAILIAEQFYPVDSNTHYYQHKSG